MTPIRALGDHMPFDGSRWSSGSSAALLRRLDLPRTRGLLVSSCGELKRTTSRCFWWSAAPMATGVCSLPALRQLSKQV